MLELAYRPEPGKTQRKVSTATQAFEWTGERIERTFHGVRLDFNLCSDRPAFLLCLTHSCAGTFISTFLKSCGPDVVSRRRL